jgi:hypothetical protein
MVYTDPTLADTLGQLSAFDSGATVSSMYATELELDSSDDEPMDATILSTRTTPEDNRNQVHEYRPQNLIESTLFGKGRTKIQDAQGKLGNEAFIRYVLWVKTHDGYIITCRHDSQQHLKEKCAREAEEKEEGFWKQYWELLARKIGSM